MTSNDPELKKRAKEYDAEIKEFEKNLKRLSKRRGHTALKLLAAGALAAGVGVGVYYYHDKIKEILNRE